MRILHTADWHLCDRLGRQDRTDDLRRVVERIAGYCKEERVDVLLDVFAAVRRELPSARLVKVGGALTPELSRQAEALGVADPLEDLQVFFSSSPSRGAGSI